MARALTKKQKGFVKDYLKTGNGRIAAEKNYNVTNKESARAVASEVLTSPNVVKALADRLSDDLLEERHLELLNKREQLTRISDEGELIKYDLGPDVQGVSKGLDMAYKLKGSYAPEKSQALNVNVEARLEDKSGLESIRQEYEDKLKARLIE